MPIQQLAPATIQQLTTAAPSQPPKAAPAASPATQLEVELAISQLERYVDVQIEQLQVMVDGALLAVTQVQNMSLQVDDAERAKAAKNAATRDFLLTVLLAFCWEMPIGGAIAAAVGKATQAVLRSVLKTNVAFQLLPLSDFGKEVEAISQLPGIQAGALSQWLKESIEERPFTSKDFAMYSNQVLSLMTKDPADLGAALLSKTIPMTVKVATAPSAPRLLEVMDTPEVSLLRSVQSFVASHRLALRVQMYATAAWLRATSVDRDSLLQTISALAPSVLPFDLDTARDHYELVYEAMIWARLYHRGTPQVAMPPFSTEASGGFEPPDVPKTPALDLSDFPDILKNYLIARFSQMVRDEQPQGLPTEPTEARISRFLNDMADSYYKQAAALQLNDAFVVQK